MLCDTSIIILSPNVKAIMLKTTFLTPVAGKNIAALLTFIRFGLSVSSCRCFLLLFLVILIHIFICMEVLRIKYKKSDIVLKQ